MKTDNNSLDAISNKIKVAAELNRGYHDRYSMLLSMLPVFSVLITIITSIMKHTSTINIARQAVIIVILTAAVSYYIKLSAQDILKKKYAKSIILICYLSSILLMMIIPKPEVVSIWMIGGLVISMVIDNKLGLLIQFNMAFVMGITLDVQPKMILQNLIVCVLMWILADALKDKTTIISGAIIILSINITLAYVINNFIFDKIADVNYYYFSVFSIIAVLVTAFFIYVQYEKMLNKRELGVELQNQVFENIILNEEEQANAKKYDENAKTSQAALKVQSTENAKAKQEASIIQNTEIRQNVNVTNSAKTNWNSNEIQTVIVNKNSIDEKQKLSVGRVAESEINSVPVQANHEYNVEYNYENIIDNKNDTKYNYEVLCNLNYSLLKKLRDFSETVYQHSLEIGDLSGRAAKEINANELLARAGGLYHEIGKINGKQYIEEGMKIAEQHEFPIELVSILKEHNIKYDKPNSVEAAIVMLSDNIASTIDYIEKTGDNRFAVNKIIDNIFKIRMDKGTFDSSGISANDFKTLKEFYQKEFNKGK